MPTLTEQPTALSRERILDVAQEIIDGEGDHELTFRRLGAELGADHTAAYRYFRSKDDLLLALGDRLIGESMEGLTLGGDWRDDLRQMAHALMDALVGHPRLAVLVSVRTTQGEQEARGIESLLATLTGAGFSIEEAVAIWRALADTVLAWCGFNAAELALPEDVRARDASAWTTTYQRLPAQTYPNIHAARAFLDEDYESFSFALELLLDGVATRLPTPSKETE